MLIRSQDKRAIINLDNVSVIQTGIISESNEIYIFRPHETTGRLVAKYATREKAMKVLDMICVRFSAGCITAYDPSVFYMPQDDVGELKTRSEKIAELDKCVDDFVNIVLNETDKEVGV